MLISLLRWTIRFFRVLKYSEVFKGDYVLNVPLLLPSLILTGNLIGCLTALVHIENLSRYWLVYSMWSLNNNKNPKEI